MAGNMSELATENGKTGFSRSLGMFFSNQVMLVVFIILFAAISLLSNKFLTSGNLFNIIRQSTVLGMMACGMTVVIVGKGVDLSAASILALSAVVNVMLQPLGYATSIIGASLVMMSRRAAKNAKTM